MISAVKLPIGFCEREGREDSFEEVTLKPNDAVAEQEKERRGGAL